jgi:hypothetical protein
MDEVGGRSGVSGFIGLISVVRGAAAILRRRTEADVVLPSECRQGLRCTSLGAAQDEPGPEGSGHAGPVTAADTATGQG